LKRRKPGTWHGYVKADDDTRRAQGVADRMTKRPEWRVRPFEQFDARDRV
jgi:hypothetical protein